MNPSVASTETPCREMRWRGRFGSLLSGRTNSGAAVQSFLVKIIVLGLNAATSITVARALKASGRGEMSAIMMWPGFFGAILTLGLPSSLTFNLRRDPDAASNTIAAASLIAILLGLLTAAIGYIAVPLWLTNYSVLDVTYARWLLLASPLPILLLFGRAALEARGNFFASNLSLWATPSLTLLWLLILVLLGRATPLSCGIAYLATSAPVAVLLIWQVFGTYQPRFMSILSAVHNLLHFGLRAWGIDLLNALAVSEQVLVVHFLSPSDMGIYVVAASLARMLSVFQTSAIIVLFPRIAAKSSGEVLSLTGTIFRVTTYGAALAAVLFGILGPVLLGLMYGNTYADLGVWSFRILLAEVVVSGATQVLAQAFLALERPGSITIIQAVGVLCGLLMMPHMIVRYGAQGAPLALLASSLIRFTITLLAFPRLLHLNIPRIIPNREDILFLRARIPWQTEVADAVQS